MNFQAFAVLRQIFARTETQGFDISQVNTPFGFDNPGLRVRQQSETVFRSKELVAVLRVFKIVQGIFQVG